MGGTQRKNLHRYMAAARRHDYNTIDTALTELTDRPAMTIFGERNDPLHFQPKWKARFPDAQQTVIAQGLHFPMCDAPQHVANAIACWHADHVLLGGD